MSVFPNGYTVVEETRLTPIDHHWVTSQSRPRVISTQCVIFSIPDATIRPYTPTEIQLGMLCRMPAKKDNSPDKGVSRRTISIIDQQYSSRRSQSHLNRLETMERGDEVANSE